MENLPAVTGNVVAKQEFGGSSLAKSAELAAVASAASAKAEIESAFIVALKNPRNEDDARVKITRTCKSPRFAEKAKYRKPVGRKKNPTTGEWEQTYIPGPSIRFAEEAARHWRNIKVIKQIIYDDLERRVIRVTTIDLEANTSHTDEISLTKTVERHSARDREVVGERLTSKGEKISIVRATEDELHNKSEAAASKFKRNQILRLIPQHIIDEAMDIVDEAKNSAVAADPELAKRKICDAFAEVGVMPGDLETLLKCTVAQASPAQVAELRDIYNSIKDGESKWVDYINGGSKAEKKEPSKGSIENLKAGDPAKHDNTRQVGKPKKAGKPKKQKPPEPESETLTDKDIESLNKLLADKKIDAETHFIPWLKREFGVEKVNAIKIEWFSDIKEFLEKQ